jgi:hypothetical protein
MGGKGTVPTELRELFSRSDQMQEVPEDMRFCAEGDARLLHHAITGEWPASAQTDLLPDA